MKASLSPCQVSQPFLPINILSNMDSALNVHEAKNMVDVEQIEDDKMGRRDPFTPEEERRLIRKLDFW